MFYVFTFWSLPWFEHEVSLQKTHVLGAWPPAGDVVERGYDHPWIHLFKSL